MLKFLNQFLSRLWLLNKREI